jgi:glycosyltransferase involved in cell wall biosynthesis
VNPERCLFSREKGNYLLYLGRVSAHKGVHEAAAFAKAADLPLKVAGPSWEHEYLEALLTDFQSTVEYLGEVGGTARTDLIAYARALLVLSQPWGGPFGGRWSEPGSTVVAEASVSGTPVIASDNGCLPEIVPGVGHVLSTLGDEKVSAAEAQRILATLPSADVVRAVAVERWGHVKTAREYLAVYRRALLGSCWT